MIPLDIADLVDLVRRDHKRALARVLSMVENGHPSSADLLNGLYDPDRTAMTLGITGPPGAGKSTLTSLLIKHWRSSARKVGVIAVDPSSPFSGGALLGDRIRMQEHATDPGVFIRSMASRGHLGGLSGATRDALEILAAASYDPVLVETVGVGQAEVEVASLADLTLLVLVPGLGDEVQTMKAGIMEIGDIIVLNKSDRSGIDQLEGAVNASLELIPDQAERPAVVKCSALTGEGMDYLTDTVDRLLTSENRRAGAAERRASLILRRVVREKGEELAERLVAGEFGSVEGAVRSIMKRETTPWMIGELLAGLADRIREKD